jgi:dienelactone hydrolase
MPPKHRSVFLTILGLVFAITPILTLKFLDRSLANGQLVSFNDPAGDRLVGTYYPGTQPNGVLLLEGFGSDQVTMTSLSSEFAGSGWSVFTFDFSGHGRSPGTLTFDNAQTDRLAHQATAALQQFAQLSGLKTEQIFIIGHSLGARVALQSAVLNPEKSAGLVLLGTQVNLSTNVQSEFFTGTTDTQLPWIQSLGPQNPPVPVLLISGAWDDILPPAGAGQLASQLSGSSYTQQEGSDRTTMVSTGNSPVREQHILPLLVHNYEPFSPRVINTVKLWLQSQTGALFTEPSTASFRIKNWITSLAGMFLLLIGVEKWVIQGQAEKTIPDITRITNTRRFLWGKLLLWLGALPVAVLLGGFFFFLPLGKPVFNLIYVCFIGGYGLLLLALYAGRKMPGVQGKLWSGRFQSDMSWKRLLAATGIAIAMLILTAAFARTGWFYGFPLNVRLAWLLIFTPFTALGFWIGLEEAQVMPREHGMQLLHTLIGLFPFFLYTILMAALGSLSGMIGGVQGMIILSLVITFGRLIQVVGQQTWLSAVWMAVLLYWLILPQGVLF